VVECLIRNLENADSRLGGAFIGKQNYPEISGDCEVARYCAGKKHAFMAEMFSVRGALSSSVTQCICGNFTFRLVTVLSMKSVVMNLTHELLRPAFP